MRLGKGIRWAMVLGLVSLSLSTGTATAQEEAGGALKAKQLFVRGMTKAYLDDHEAALNYYQQALNLAPNEAAVLSAVAASQDALDNTALAIFYAEQARHYAENNVFYHRQLAELHHKSGRSTQSPLGLRRAARSFPHRHRGAPGYGGLTGRNGPPWRSDSHL